VVVVVVVVFSGRKMLKRRRTKELMAGEGRHLNWYQRLGKDHQFLHKHTQPPNYSLATTSITKSAGALQQYPSIASDISRIHVSRRSWQPIWRLQMNSDFFNFLIQY